jgi:hypothetical protein
MEEPELRAVYNTAARSNWIHSAMLGYDHSIESLHYNYDRELPVSKMDSAIWGLVAVELSTKGKLFSLSPQGVADKLTTLSEIERDVARRRADVLIKQIKKNKEEYDRLVDPTF